MGKVNLILRLNCIVVILFYYSSVLSQNDTKVNFDKSKIKETYFKELKTKMIKINESLFFKDSLIGDETNGYSRFLFFYDKSLKKFKKDIPRINPFDSYESPSFLIFNSSIRDKQVLIWKIEDEFFSKVYIYSIKKEQFIFTGKIVIGKFCKPECDTFNLSNNDISIFGDVYGFDIIFSGKTFFSSSEYIKSKKGGRIIADNLTLSFFY